MAALLSASCSSSHGEEPDGAVAEDAATPGLDAAPIEVDAHGGIDAPTTVDAGPRSHVGDPCRSDDDCEVLACSARPRGFGYCSWLCESGIPCPDDGVCVQFEPGSPGYCMERCDPSDPVVCADGYVCADVSFEAPVCYPGCESDSDCTDGTVCGDALARGVRQCVDPTAHVGDPCETSLECPNLGLCVDERGWGAPSGTCVTFCNVATGIGCDEAAVCVAWGLMGGPSAGSCIPVCDEEHPCREGYVCQPTGEAPAPNGCVPRCGGNDDCTGGRTCNFVSGRCG